jgi:hypothetical protein
MCFRRFVPFQRMNREIPSKKWQDLNAFRFENGSHSTQQRVASIKRRIMRIMIISWFVFTVSSLMSAADAAASSRGLGKSKQYRST